MKKKVIKFLTKIIHRYNYQLSMLKWKEVHIMKQFNLSIRHYSNDYQQYIGKNVYFSYDEDLYLLFANIIISEQDLNDVYDLLPLIEYPIDDTKEVIHQLKILSLPHEDKFSLMEMVQSLAEDDMLYLSYE